MSLPANYVGIPGDRCSCGRRASLRHCPSCGSYRIRLRPSARSIRQQDPSHTPEVIDRFMCERCGFIFDDSIRKFCEAPVYLTKAQRLAAEYVRAKAAQAESEPLTGREQKLVETLDPIRFQLEAPLDSTVGEGLVGELPSTEVLADETQSGINEDLVRRLRAEYAARCIKTGQKASPEDCQKYVDKRLSELSRNS